MACMRLKNLNTNIWAAGFMFLAIWSYWASGSRCADGQDYSPCSCNGYEVECRDVTIDSIRQAFSRTHPASQQQPSTDTITRLTLFLHNDKPLFLPSDLVGNHYFRGSITLRCLSTDVPLKLHQDAFRSSKSHTTEFHIYDCNLDQLDLSFLSGFEKLSLLAFWANTQLDKLVWSTFPSLPSLAALNLNSNQGLQELSSNPPAPIDARLSQLMLRGNGKYFGDEALEKTLNWLATSSVSTLENLFLDENGLSKVPKQVETMTKLESLSMLGTENHFPVLPNGFLANTPISVLEMQSSAVEKIETGAFLREFKPWLNIDLAGNKLTSLDEATFKPVLEQMAKANGVMNLNANPFDCSFRTLCNWKWLVVDNPHLLEVVSGTCADGKTSFKDLSSVSSFKDCEERGSLSGGSIGIVSDAVIVILLFLIILV